MMRLRFQCVPSRKSPSGWPVVALGLRAGFWPLPARPLRAAPLFPLALRPLVRAPVLLGCPVSVTPYDPKSIPALFAHRPIESLITIDFESFYDEDYGFSCLNTEQYVRGDRWETILVGVKVDHAPAVWMTPETFVEWARGVAWDRVGVLCHNAHFDCLILSHHYGIRPAFIACTLSIARALHGIEVGNSLKKLAPFYGAGEKGEEVVLALGKHRRDFTPEEYAQYGQYCVNDCELTRFIFDRMVEEGFPENELWVIDTTIRMFTEPQLIVDEDLLKRYAEYEDQRKDALVARVCGSIDESVTRKVLRSGDKLAEILLREFDIEAPRKLSPSHKCKDVCPKKGTEGHTCKSSCVCEDPCPKTETWAFAKSDPGMQDLLEHENEEVRWLAEARVAVMSTINETRSRRFLRAGANGRAVPVYQKYAAAHTFRAGGGDKMNFQNLERVPEDPKPGEEWKGTLRKSLLAPGPTAVTQ
jgi:hypothetical protein